MECVGIDTVIQKSSFHILPNGACLCREQISIGRGTTVQTPFDENPRICSTYQTSFCSVTTTFFQLPDARKNNRRHRQKRQNTKEQLCIFLFFVQETILYVFIALFVWELYILLDW